MSVNSTQPDLERTKRAQRDAADPRTSAWVNANAGTGKTHVLTQRALRLMLAGTIPERILCLTYTKAAAAEMSKRVYDTLGKWVTMPEDKLVAALTDLSDRAPSADEIARARILFTAAIETPGGLKVQTIHSFCERLLQRFPLEADVAPGFTILDDATTHLLQREATDAVLRSATADRASPVGRALEAAIRYAGDERFDELLREALSERRWLEQATRIGIGNDADELTAVEEIYRDALGVRSGITEDKLIHEMTAILGDAELIRLRDALSGGGKSDTQLADTISKAITAGGRGARVGALQGYFCTGEGKPRSRLMTKAVKEKYPDLDDAISNAQRRFVALLDERRGLAIVAATIALHRLAGAVLQHYTRAKARRAALDYEDLIAKTVTLLHERQWAAWVLFKLDRGIDHILVDEAQDTSREQWQVVEAIAEEFFGAEGKRGEPRTLFAVGDEKQSIYSFQGAAPEMFAKMGKKFAALTENASQPWRSIPLDLSFRTVAPILASVDHVFADPDRTPGITAEAAVIRHGVHRLGQAGRVEIWPTEKHGEAEDADVWAPLQEGVSSAPQLRLAERIATTIQHWIDTGERLASENRPIEPGDILILVRKRRPFAGPMVAALKARNIPVAGADRLRLAEQIAVEDLVSLGDFLTLPDDDLALAEVLKSPLFGFDDDDLLALSVSADGKPRKGTLWKALIDKADEKPHFGAAVETLKRWRARADYIPPFEFFAGILDREGGRAKFLARLGLEAADPLDEFLNLALAYDDQAPPSLTGFLAYLREANREVKRDMEQGRNEVRVMTVHGAKGLEAPIVFLPDTCTTASGGRGALLELPDVDLPKGVKEKPFVWSVPDTGNLAVVAKAKTQRNDLDAQERHRLLYVAMTRARDQLYVAGFEGKSGRRPGCWYELIDETLRENFSTVTGSDGAQVFRLDEAQTGPHEQRKHAIAEATGAVQLPPWAMRPAPREPSLTIPLAPSRLEAYEPDASGEPLPGPPRQGRLDEPPVLSPIALTHENRFLRGTLTHALLEHLPSLPAESWKQAATDFIDKRGIEFPPHVRKGIVKETLAILTGPEFAALFGPQSRAEVPIVALIPNPKPNAPPLKLIGTIDRLIDLGNELLIVDYKTNRPPPSKPEDVAPAYLLQLAAYRLAIAQIYPGRTVQAALLWTETPRIMPIATTTLDEYASRLWDFDLGHLDASQLHS